MSRDVFTNRNNVITVCLSDKEKIMLNELSHKTGFTKSHIVREAIKLINKQREVLK